MRKEREKGEARIRRIFLGVKNTRAEEGDCSQGSARCASCYFIYYFGIPVYIHLRFSGCFQEAVLADWSGH